MNGEGNEIHFMGIGGVSMQALALWCRREGLQVSGCDSAAFDASRLTAAGVRVHVGHDPAHLSGVGMVVHSMAVPSDHPELESARRAGVRVLRRIELLGELFSRRKTIGVTGTHGKSTTTGMLATMLLELDPESSVQLGATLPAIGGAYRYGQGDWLAAEVDESDPGFAQLKSHVALITNLDDDHVAGEHEERRNYYGSFAELKAAARTFANASAHLVRCSDWPTVCELTAHHENAVGYGFAKGADYRIIDLELAPLASRFTLKAPGLPLFEVELGVPGRHNVVNAAGAIAALHQAGFDPRAALTALRRFAGVGRRWQVWGERGGALIVDDFAHHPTEVKVTLEAARGTGRRVRAVLQPHRFIRTARQWPALAAAASAADEVLVLDIYGAGERPIANVSSNLIVNRLTEKGVPARAVDPAAAISYLSGSLAPNDLVITLGAGDVWRVAAALMSDRQQQAGAAETAAAAAETVTAAAETVTAGAEAFAASTETGAGPARSTERG